MTWMEGSHYWYFGGLCLNVYTLGGPWISLGIHLSFKPFYVDLHIIWWVISLMGEARGEFIHETEELTNAWLEVEEESKKPLDV